MLSTDPIDMLLDETTHDVVLEDGDIQWSSGKRGVAQDIKINTGMIAGEYFYDLDEGIALLSRPGIDPDRVILGKKFSKARALAEYTPAILKSAAVTAVESLNVSFDRTTRKLDLKYRADTEFDDTVADSLSTTVGG